MKRKFLTEAPIKRLNNTFQPYPHDYPRAETTEDGSEIHRFRFAFPRGMLDKRMSAKELSEFVLKHIIATLNMRLLDFTDFVCQCGWRSRLQPEDTICPVCNHKCTTVNRTEVQEEFARILEKFVNITVSFQNTRFSTLTESVVPSAPYLLRTHTLKSFIDELVPWAKVTKAGERSNIPGQPADDNDYIELNLHDKTPIAPAKLIFDVGAGAVDKAKLHNDLVKAGMIECPTHSSILKGSKN